MKQQPRQLGNVKLKGEKQKLYVPKSPAQKLRDYLERKYGKTRNIFIRKNTKGKL